MHLELVTLKPEQAVRPFNWCFIKKCIINIVDTLIDVA